MNKFYQLGGFLQNFGQDFQAFAANPLTPGGMTAMGLNLFANNIAERRNDSYARNYQNQWIRQHGQPSMVTNPFAFGNPNVMRSGGIHINPANRGKFTETKKRTGKSTEELTHSKNPLTRRRAIFAQNARKWEHWDGGAIDLDHQDWGNGYGLYDQSNLLMFQSGGNYPVYVAPNRDEENSYSYADNFWAAADDIQRGRYPGYDVGARPVMAAQKQRAIEDALVKYGNSPDVQKLMRLVGNNSVPAPQYGDSRAEKQIFRTEQPYVSAPSLNATFPSIQSYMSGNYKEGGGLSRKDDYGSKKKPYPSVSKGDFAGPGRSYPIPTRADAVDALRLAGLHGRDDVKAKVYAKYPDLKKQEGGFVLPFIPEYMIGGPIPFGYRMSHMNGQLYKAQEGGFVKGQTYDLTPAQIQALQDQGYELEF